MEDLEPYLDKFSESGRRILKSALNETRHRDQNYILPEHILYALMEEETDLFNTTMRNLSIDPEDIRLAVEKRLENSPQHTGKNFSVAPETTEIFKYSMDRARSEGRRTIEASDICSVLAANKYSLLNDILQNPEGSVPVFQTRRIGTEEKQSYFPSQLQNKPSNFFNEFSLKELVKKNTSSFGLFHSIGSIGGGMSGGDLEQTTHSKHESFACRIESKDSNNFNEEKFISSLRKDVEDSMNQSRLKITETNNPNSSSFRLKYKTKGMKGQIDISGEMKNGYYELKAMAVEKSGQKTK